MLLSEKYKKTARKIPWLLKSQRVQTFCCRLVHYVVLGYGRFKSKATGMGHPWQQSQGVINDLFFAAIQRRAHGLYGEQVPTLIYLTWNALLSLKLD
jgi:hypothetical protein